MRHALRGFALSALLFTACGGYGYVGIGYYPCDPYYDPYCYDYYYAQWDPSTAAPLDLDGDGSLDLAVSDGRLGRVWFMEGQSGGGFTAAPAAPLDLSAPAAGVAALNANGDGLPDLLVLDGATGALSVFTGDGQGGFAAVAPTAVGPALPHGITHVARGRLDGDALDDLAFVVDGGVRVALGTGTGSFLEVGGAPAAAFLGPDAATRAAGLFVALADVDDRPGTDLVVVDAERAALGVCSGNGDGTFGEARVVSFTSLGDVLDVAPVTLAAGGTADLALLFGDRARLGAAGTLAVARLDDGRFEPAPFDVGTARALVPRDLDGDGLTDLLLLDPAAGAIRTLHAERR